MDQLIRYSEKPQEVREITTPIIQMRKLSLREVEYLPQDHTPKKWWPLIPSWASNHAANGLWAQCQFPWVWDKQFCQHHHDLGCTQTQSYWPLAWDSPFSHLPSLWSYHGKVLIWCWMRSHLTPFWYLLLSSPPPSLPPPSLVDFFLKGSQASSSGNSTGNHLGKKTLQVIILFLFHGHSEFTQVVTVSPSTVAINGFIL